MQTELKTDLRIVKEEITTRMRDELTELKDDIEHKFAKIPGTWGSSIRTEAPSTSQNMYRELKIQTGMNVK